MVMPEVREAGLASYLASKGVSRRTFLKFCGGVAAAIGLSSTMGPKVAEALEIGSATGKLIPVVWIEAGSCSGCTESLAQAVEPDVATLVLDYLSLNYSETLSAAAGHSLEKAKEETIEAGGYILIYEGAVMTGWDGNALMVADEKGTDALIHAASNALAVISAGSCAVDGGWCAAHPNPAGAMGVQKFLKQNGIATPVINLPSCPVNPEHIVEVVMNFVLTGALPKLNSNNEPELSFGQLIHENCPRRGHFENGEFVYEFGSDEERKGYCLYAMGCKGPQTYSNCPVVRWNGKASWCVEAGAPCIGCASCNPRSSRNNWVNNNAPFLQRFHDMHIGTNFQPTTLAIAVTGIAGVAIAAHGFGMKFAGRTKGGAPIETESDWSKKQPKATEAPEVVEDVQEGGDE